MRRWRSVRGYTLLYQVSNDGLVRSLDKLVKSRGHLYHKKGKLLKLRKPLNTKERIAVTLAKDGVSKRYSVHTLVCTAFHGPKPTPLHEVNHKDLNHLNNHEKNLEWVTKSENIKHAYDNGSPIGWRGR